MLDYAAKLTLTPQAVSATDVQKLRAAGFDDASSLDICQVVSYYAYVNRLADGLGVELEASWTEDQITISREELPAAAARAGQGG